MSNAIAHRPHAHHVPWMPTVLAVIVAVIIAAAVIYAINQPTTPTITTPAVTAVTAPVSAAAVAPTGTVARHQAAVRRTLVLLHAQDPQALDLYLRAIQRHVLLETRATP